ncbi:MAG TPA: molybdopterin cofactor-binding domain-containing protein, partial [Aggregatilineales bacterium]|nr:molybdopterin cofactor-binding domain-containing protein [Aggregatilineales bacterium]
MAVFGTSIKRREDPRLITGEAKYLEDLVLPGMAHAAVLRSPHAHARIKSIDTSAAAAHPGVIGVFTGKDFEEINPLPCAWQAGGTTNNVNTPRMLEINRVTFTGAGVAVVVAEDRYTAQDALEKIVVDYEVLPAVVDAEKATQPGAPQIHENAASNIVMDWEVGDKDETARALNGADTVIKHRLVNQRLIPTAMEPRGAIAQYLAATG